MGDYDIREPLDLRHPDCLVHVALHVYRCAADPTDAVLLLLKNDGQCLFRPAHVRRRLEVHERGKHVKASTFDDEVCRRGAV